MPLEPAVFRRFCEIAHDRAGIAIRQGKESLVESRVAIRMRALKLSDAREYLEHLESDASGSELVQFLDVVTTNYTRFFRGPEHFDLIGREVLRKASEGQRTFRIWCAAASTGEEPYSVAVTILEATRGMDVDFRILGTDISTRALLTARRAIYDIGTMRDVPVRLRNRYFKCLPGTHDRPPRFQASPGVAEHVVLHRLNLAEPPFPMRGPIDFVLCRNVMFYFAEPTRSALVHEAERLLCPGGLFFIGQSETLTGVRTSLRRVEPSVYTKPDRGQTFMSGMANLTHRQRGMG